jgi:uncharacterized glyoxalase superfamily protein PhnB
MALMTLLTVFVLPVVFVLMGWRTRSVAVFLLLAQGLSVFIVLEFVGEAHEEFDPFSMLLGDYLMSHKFGVCLTMWVTSLVVFLTARLFFKNYDDK